MQGAISHFIWAIRMSLFVIETAKKVDSEFGHVFLRFFEYFSSFFYSKKSLKLIPLFPDLLIQWGSVPEEWPSRGNAENTVSNGRNMLKIAVNTKFHERLQCVISKQSLVLDVLDMFWAVFRHIKGPYRQRKGPLYFQIWLFKIQLYYSGKKISKIWCSLYVKPKNNSCEQFWTYFGHFLRI